MYLHAPDAYLCPFCRIVQQYRAGGSQASADMICQDDQTSAFLALARWPKNPLDVLIVPNAHFENIFDLPVDLALPLQAMSRAVALALKQAYACDGVSFRQHNEPAGSQDIWHYHIHATPRFSGDEFYHTSRIPFPEEERLEAAKMLRAMMLRQGRGD
jgi:histidine triad (HIT) family protein